MREGVRILGMVGMLWAAALAEEPITGATQVDDEADFSSPYSDMITTAEKARKAGSAVGAAVRAGKFVKQVKANGGGAKGVMSTGKQNAKAAIKGAAFKYKNTKLGLLKFMYDMLDKISKALDFAEDRVNMWRSTETVLKYYTKSMGRMADNTVEVFKDFRVKDLVDIDRKWSRRMENQIHEDRRMAMDFAYWLQSQYRDANDPRTQLRTLFMSFFSEGPTLVVGRGEEKEERVIPEEFSRTAEDIAAYLAMGEPHEFRSVPMRCMAFAGDGLEQVRAIADQAYGPDQKNPEVARQTRRMNHIHHKLVDGNMTFEDTRQLGALIQRTRAEVNVQSVELEQIYAQLQVRYSRLLMRDAEMKAIQYEDFDNTLNVICNGGAFRTVDDARRERFGEQAGVM